MDGSRRGFEFVWAVVSGIEFSYVEVDFGIVDVIYRVEVTIDFGLFFFGLVLVLGYGIIVFCSSSE